MVTFFVNERTDKKGGKGVAHGKKIYLKRGQGAVKHHLSEVADINVEGVGKKQAAPFAEGCGGDKIEDCRGVHNQHRENAPEILHIAEENVECRENKPHAHVEHHEAENGDYEREHRKRENRTLKNAENKEHNEGKPEVDKRGNNG